MSQSGAFRVVASELAAVGLDDVKLGLDELTRVLACAEMMAGDSLVGLQMAERVGGRGVLGEVAAHVGFADGAAFGKAFRSLVRRVSVGTPAAPRHGVRTSRSGCDGCRFFECSARC